MILLLEIRDPWWSHVAFSRQLSAIWRLLEIWLQSYSGYHADITLVYSCRFLPEFSCCICSDACSPRFDLFFFPLTLGELMKSVVCSHGSLSLLFVMKVTSDGLSLCVQLSPRLWLALIVLLSSKFCCADFTAIAHICVSFLSVSHNLDTICIPFSFAVWIFFAFSRYICKCLFKNWCTCASTSHVLSV
jgi:hypothetical protein